MPDYNSLAKQALKGDYEAFEQLVEHHKDKVYSTCLLLVGSVPEGLEAAEQVFVAAYRSLHETEGKAVSDWIYRQAETHASGLRNELQRRGFPQRHNQTEALKISDELKAPPGFTAAVRERLRLEADLARKAASRRRSRTLAAGVAAASAALFLGWAVYWQIPPAQEQGRDMKSQLSSTLASPVTTAPATTSTLPAPTTTVPPTSATAPILRASLPARKEQKLESLPEIVISSPRSDTSSLEKIFNSVNPPLRSLPVRDGSSWAVDLTDDQFWSMHKLLKDAYSKIRVPESAIPNDRARTKLRLRLIPTASAPKKAGTGTDQVKTGIEIRSRLPIEDLLKE